MVASQPVKERIKRELVAALKGEPEIRSIVVFGSFVRDAVPHDLDVAIFQDSKEGYLPLALKYRRMIRAISRVLPVDVIPLRAGATGDPFLREISAGEVVYEG